MSRIDDARERLGPGPIEKSLAKAGRALAVLLVRDPFEAMVALLLYGAGMVAVGLLLGFIVGWLA